MVDHTTFVLFSFSQLINSSIKQPVNQLINQSNNQLISFLLSFHNINSFNNNFTTNKYSLKKIVAIFKLQLYLLLQFSLVYKLIFTYNYLNQFKLHHLQIFSYKKIISIKQSNNQTNKNKIEPTSS